MLSINAQMTREKKRDSSEKRSSNNKYSSNLKLTGVMMFSILLLAMIVAPVSYLLLSAPGDEFLKGLGDENLKGKKR